jgi:FtsH-binding integral membrane protein
MKQLGNIKSCLADYSTNCWINNSLWKNEARKIGKIFLPLVRRKLFSNFSWCLIFVLFSWTISHRTNKSKSKNFVCPIMIHAFVLAFNLRPTNNNLKKKFYIKKIIIYSISATTLLSSLIVSYLQQSLPSLISFYYILCVAKNPARLLMTTFF